MDQAKTLNEFYIAGFGGLLIAISTSLNYLIWGQKEMITEQFFKIWTLNDKIFQCIKTKGCTSILT